MFSLGVYFLSEYAWGHVMVPSERDLIFAEGSPTEATEITVRGRYGVPRRSLRIKLGLYKFIYDASYPHYEDLMAAIENRDNLQAWVIRPEQKMLSDPE